MKCLRAIEIATDKGKCNKGYISGILKQWSDNNIKSIEDLNAYEVGFRNRGLVMESIKMSIRNLNMPENLKKRMKVFIESQHQINLKKPEDHLKSLDAISEYRCNKCRDMTFIIEDGEARECECKALRDCEEI